MKFILTKVSDWDLKDVIEINTLEELLEIYKKNGTLVITDNWVNDEEFPDIKLEIEIYDSYRE